MFEEIFKKDSMGCLSVSPPESTWGHMQLNSSGGRTGRGSPRWPLFPVCGLVWLLAGVPWFSTSPLISLEWAPGGDILEVF